MGKRWRLLLAALCFSACVDKSTSGPTVEEGAGPSDMPADGPVCATCQQRAGGETADFGASPGAGAGTCASMEAPLTAEVEQAYELAQLREFLASPRVVVAEPRAVLPGQPDLQGPIEIEFRIALGEFTYRTGENCDSVSAPLELTAEVGDGLLSFDAKGMLFKEAGKLYANMYAKANLAAAKGSYRPQVDASRPHVGQIEVPIYVFPEQLRGSVLPELIYFQSEEHAAAWLEGRPSPTPGPGSLPDFDTLVHLDFPSDGCSDNELPLAFDTKIDLLGGRSPEQLRRDAVVLMETVPSIAAVWHDDSTTVVQVEQSEGPKGTVCVNSESRAPDWRTAGPELVLNMPGKAVLRTQDGKIDLPLDKLSVAVRKDQHELRWAGLSGTAPYRPSVKLDGRITYTFANGSVAAEGIVQTLKEVSPGAGTQGDECLAFPPGSRHDTGMCRYRR